MEEGRACTGIAVRCCARIPAFPYPADNFSGQTQRIVMNLRADSAMLPSVALFTAMMLWASSYIAMKIAVGGYDPIVVVFFRMLLGTCTFGLAWRQLRRVRLRKGDWKPLLLMALCEPCIYFILEAYAMRYTSASQAGMIASSMPIFVALGAFFFLGERLSRRVWGGFLLASSGVVWLSLAGESTESAPNPLLGNTLETLAMASAAVYVVIAKRLSAYYPPLFITAAQCTAGTVFFFPLLFLPTTQMPAEFPPDATLSVVYLGTVITIGAYGLYNYGVSKIPAGQAGAWINLIPVATLVMGWLILGETLTPTQYLASVLVLLGVYLTQR